jgi:F0F1-type ATP synthase assembly protein I
MAEDPERSTSTGNGGDAAFEDLKRRRADASATQQMFAISGIGIEFICEVGAMILIGWWLDRHFATSPTWTLVGVGVGFTIGLYRLVRFAKKNMQ